jgi:hypothetical protein
MPPLEGVPPKLGAPPDRAAVSLPESGELRPGAA